uniref:histidine kinase n=1 Tax=Roseihalotalea indica TaxID=2867963 RepID=A0AA49JDK0_9BACT|nr:chemotaxis protein CheB [Tunicatimonas sp. TK19036]
MSERKDFFIVGIGASAGGLEALQEFFSKLPDSNPAAFVVIQHLSPDFKSMMDELLAKHTRMPIKKVTRTVKIKPNHVYLMSPRKNLELVGDSLVLREKIRTQKPNLPIDQFFDSLGKHWGINSVGIILSGTGTDGSRGIKTIKEQGGIIMVQHPDSAKFDGMPNATMLTGLADFVLRLPKMAEEVDRIIHHSPQISDETGKLPTTEQDFIGEILELVTKETRINFNLYKEATILRRMQKRMHITNVNTLKGYHHILASNPEEVKQLSNEFLIGVSSFFRDGHPWKVFTNDVLPVIIDQKEEGDTIRVWIAGCASGEEAYTIGMLIDDYISKQHLPFSYKIFSSDIDKRSIYTASMGIYPSSIAEAVPPDLITSYFDKVGNNYKVKKSFRDHFVFASQNIISDPPFIKMDVVSCRNVLIYLNSEVQQKVISNFHFSLNKTGFLILGKSENIGNMAVFFSPIGEKTNIYQNRIAFNRKLHHTYLPKTSFRTDLQQQKNATETPLLSPSYLNNLITKAYEEDGVWVNSHFQIMHVKGNLDRYFHFPKNNLSMHLEDVLGKDEYLLMKSGILEALRVKKAVYYDKALFKKEKTRRLVDLRFKAIEVEALQQKIVYIEFRNDRKPEPSHQTVVTKLNEQEDQRLTRLVQELEEKQRIIQLLREELDSHNEELQTSTEELLASNEELQSSNEELQSVNEEIYSVNSELQEKISEITQINNDIINLLNSTEIATIFIDQDYLIRKLTPKISEIINISERDIGRSIDHFTTKLKNVSLMSITHSVMETEQPLEREVSLQSEEKCYLMRVLPYRKADGTMNGLVITFVDISEIKDAQIEIKNARLFAENIVNTFTDPLIVLNAELKVISANPAFHTTFKAIPEHISDQLIYDLGNGYWNLPALHHLLEDIIPEKSLVTGYQIEHDFPDIGHRIMLFNAITISQTGNIPDLVLLAIRDITEEEIRRKQLIETAERLNIVIQTSNIGTWEYNTRTQEVSADKRLRELFDLPPKRQLTFKDIASKIHPEDYQRVYKSLSSSIEQNKTYSTEFRIVKKNEEIRYVTGHGNMLLNDEGEPFKMIGINVDVTERKRAEENSAHYGRLLEESYNEIYIFNAKTLHFINVNSGALKNLGYTMDEVLTLTPLDLKPEYTQEKFTKLLEPLRLGKEKTIAFNTVHRRKNGSLYNVFVTLQLSTFQDKLVFIAIVQDTTAQTIAQQELRQNQERWAFAISGTSDGIWDWPDMNQEKIWWSPRLYQLLGLEDNEIEASLENYQSLIHPKDKEIRRRAFMAHIRNDKPFDVVIRLYHKTKGYRWFRSRGQVIRDKEGNPLRMAGLVSDIHNQKLSENKLKRTNRDLRIANEYLDNFVFTAAHDLRAPVANLKSLAGLLQTQEGQDNRVVEKIDLSIDRLEKTLRGLIKILDIQQTDRKEYSQVSFKKVLQKVMKDLDQMIKETQATITYDFQIKTIQYVEPYVVSIFRNLISNALKFHFEGRPPEIHIQSIEEKSYVCLTVRDNGVGMNLERFRKKLFKAFERLSKSGNGLGIGLHIVKTIVEKNEGFIEVQSEVNQGTTFLVYLKPYSNEEENIAH